MPPPPAKYEAGATGRLTFSLVGYSRSGRPQAWSDRKRWTVEDKLPELLREIETRAVEACERELEERRKAAERKRAWEQAMELAGTEFVEQRRADGLVDQVERWRRASGIRAYCVAMEQAHPESPTTAEWVAWARRYSDSIDPLSEPPAMPTDPETISQEDLKPFLGGWSPHGPDRW